MRVSSSYSLHSFFNLEDLINLTALLCLFFLVFCIFLCFVIFKCIVLSSVVYGLLNLNSYIKFWCNKISDSYLNSTQIAVQGCSHGELDNIYESIIESEKETGNKIDLLICCGDFQVCVFFLSSHRSSAPHPASLLYSQTFSVPLRLLFASLLSSSLHPELSFICFRHAGTRMT